MTVYRGSCICGNIEIQFTTAIAPASLTIRKFRCPFCVSNQAATATDPKDQVKILIDDRTKVNRHDFSCDRLKNAGFLVCNGCGAYDMKLAANREFGTVDLTFGSESSRARVYPLKNGSGAIVHVAQRWQGLMKPNLLVLA